MPIDELKPGARALIRENMPKLIVVSTIFVAIITVADGLNFRLLELGRVFDHVNERISDGEYISFGMFFSGFSPPAAAFAVVLWLLRQVVGVGFVNFCMRINRKQDGRCISILHGFLYFTKIIILYVITTALIILWSLLLIFPGIMAYYRYRQAFYILLDAPEKGIIQCISESKRLMAGNKLDLFLLDLSFIGWHILNLIVIISVPVPFALPIVSIWLTPYIGLSRTAYYDRLVGILLV